MVTGQWVSNFTVEKPSTMEDKHIVRQQIMIEAPPSAIWDALTDPKKTTEYFFHCEVESTWDIGSTISFKGRVFLLKKIELTGTILDIEPGKFLKYTLHNDDDYREPSFSTITISLMPENGMVRVSVTDDVGKGQGSEDRYERSVKGWARVLKGLKELVEEEKDK